MFEIKIVYNRNGTITKIIPRCMIGPEAFADLGDISRVVEEVQGLLKTGWEFTGPAFRELVELNARPDLLGYRELVRAVKNAKRVTFYSSAQRIENDAYRRVLC